MIVIPAHTLWTLLGIMLAVTVCAFAFGWCARAYRIEDQAELDRAARRHATVRRLDDLPRPGRLPVPPAIIDLEPSSPPARWWPALERHAHADTIPFSHVEVSNWEANLRRKQDAWLHERGMQ